MRRVGKPALRRSDYHNNGGGIRIFGIVSHSGMGKTTLLERLVPELVQRGLRVSLVKHSDKSVDIDRPGKDSYRLREAGCHDVVIVGRDRWAVVHELRDDPEPDFADVQASMRPCAVLLVVGMKALGIPKLEVWRAGLASRCAERHRTSWRLPATMPSRMNWPDTSHACASMTYAALVISCCVDSQRRNAQIRSS